MESLEEPNNDRAERSTLEEILSTDITAEINSKYSLTPSQIT
jgi:hypothetical protein